MTKQLEFTKPFVLHQIDYTVHWFTSFFSGIKFSDYYTILVNQYDELAVVEWTECECSPAKLRWKKMMFKWTGLYRGYSVKRFNIPQGWILSCLQRTFILLWRLCDVRGLRCRSDTPLLYKAVPSWFVRVEQLVPKLLESNKNTRWWVRALEGAGVWYVMISFLTRMGCWYYYNNECVLLVAKTTCL